MCPNSVWTIVGRCFLIRCRVSPGHDMAKIFCIALMKVDLDGEKQAACKNVAKSFAFLSTLKIMLRECCVGIG